MVFHLFYKGGMILLNMQTMQERNLAVSYSNPIKAIRNVTLSGFC